MEVGLSRKSYSGETAMEQQQREDRKFHNSMKSLTKCLNFDD